ncbi:MAG: FAD-binding protein, partial [Clostridiales bacterium]|nr:FAD-binding protein [Clostridiales bacterium]
MNQLDPVVRRLREQLPALTILENEPMRAHCSFRIGGPVRALAQPSSAEETAALCRILRSADVTPLIIGNGTNLLVTDAELNRIVIQMGDNMAEAGQTGPDTLQAGCGIPLARLAQTALACGLGGMEFAHGIPGSLGGAVSMNAGAYGGEMKDIVVTTQYLDESLEVREVHGAAHDFGYRHSRFSDTGAVILASTLRLTPGDPAAIRARIEAFARRQNCVSGRYAGQLNEQAPHSMQLITCRSSAPLTSSASTALPISAM